MTSVPSGIASPGTIFGLASTCTGTPAACAATASRSSLAGATTRAISIPSLRNASNIVAPKYRDPTTVQFIDPFSSPFEWRIDRPRFRRRDLVAREAGLYTGERPFAAARRGLRACRHRIRVPRLRRYPPVAQCEDRTLVGPVDERRGCDRKRREYHSHRIAA